eukprot:Trichotokara_eunicae@DN6197_c0_g1_i3.p1
MLAWEPSLQFECKTAGVFGKATTGNFQTVNIGFTYYNIAGWHQFLIVGDHNTDRIMRFVGRFGLVESPSEDDFKRTWGFRFERPDRSLERLVLMAEMLQILSPTSGYHSKFRDGRIIGIDQFVTEDGPRRISMPMGVRESSEECQFAPAEDILDCQQSMSIIPTWH